MKICSKNKWVALVLLIGVLWLGISGCTSKQEKVAKFLSKGDALLAKGDATRAILEYKNALQIDPKNPRAMLALGKAYLAKKEYRKAFGSFRSALELDPSFDEAHIELASLLSLAKQGQKALEELSSVKKPARFEPRFSIIKGRALVSLQRYKQAIDTINSLSHKDTNRDALLILSVCYRELGDKERLSATISKWEQVSPKDPSPYIFMAQYYLRQGNKTEAARQLTSMLRTDPGNPKLRLFRAQALERLGLVQKAKEAYKELPREPSMLKAQAGFWIRQRDFDKAKALLSQILATNPKDVQALALLAEVLTAQGHVEQALARLHKTPRKGLAKEDAEKLDLIEAKLQLTLGEIKLAKKICSDVLERNQGNMEAHLLLGKILLAEGDLDNAEVHLSQVAVARPNDAKAQILLARCQLLNKKDAVAGDTLKKALANIPADRRLRLELVRYYVMKNEYDKAIRVLERGLKISPRDILLLKAKGEIEALRKNYEAALKVFEQLIKLAPDNPVGYMEMGRLMVAHKSYKDAIKWFSKAYGTKGGWRIALPAIIQTYAIADKLDKAVEVAKLETKKRPRSALAYYYLGKVLMAKGSYAEAASALARSSKLAPEWPEPYRALAQMYVRQNKISKAIAQMEQVYNKAKSLPTGLNLASLYEYDGQYNKAAAIYTELLKKHKRSPILLNNLAYLYAEHFADRKRLEQAADMVMQALALKPDAPNLLDTAAWIAYKQGKLNVAWNYLQDALDKGGQNPVIQLHAAIVSHDLGKEDLAMEHLEKAIEQKLDPRIRDQALGLKKKWAS